MAAENDKNVFASPWNSSDMVLVVEDQELHVHKWILITHSPVFKAMLEGHFQEASQDKITLKEKDLQSMEQFLKILYPSSMFGEARKPLDDKSRLSILALAEEYQCVNLIKLCIDEVKLTRENVLQILPYAVKYHQEALPEMFKVINWSASASKLEEVLPNLESKEISSSNKMLLSKCRFLESGIVQMQDAIISLICDLLWQKKIAANAKMSLKKIKDDHEKGTCPGVLAPMAGPVYTNWKTTADSLCLHSISIREINKTSCVKCKKKYKDTFIAPIPSCQRVQSVQKFFNMLLMGDAINYAVKEQK
jgi:hypothetical protein